MLPMMVKVSAWLLPKAERTLMQNEWLTELSYIQEQSRKDAQRFVLFLPVAALKMRFI